MIPFKAPLDDMMFCLSAAGRADALEDWDSDFAREIATHFAAFAEGEIAPTDEPGDMQGARLENGRVRMPDGFREVYRAYVEQGWPGLTAPEEHGGQGLGPLMLALTSEIFSGANQSLQMVTGLVPGAIRTLMQFGSAEQQARLVQPLASGEWLSTMCLTEPGAGSDLSRIRTKAVQDGNGYRISGEKIFISGGDQDMSEGVFHLVLARTSDDGIRGLSLFACPPPGDGIKVTRIEEKMGLHASPTCQMVFEDAPAELIGAEGQGLKAMFTMMNHARLDVSLQGVAHSARAAHVARDYAATRQQGGVSIDRHADVARMIDRADMLALGARGIVHLAYVAMERGDAPDLVEFLTPVAKYHCTEAGQEAANLGIQVLGGYGYLREYRLEQTFRDVRIAAIYEGANGIHARSLATRSLRAGHGQAFAAFLAGEGAAMADLAALWDAAQAHVVAQDDPAPLADDFMQLTAQVLLAAIWHRLESSADRHPEPDRIRRLAATALRDAPIWARAHAQRMGVALPSEAA